MDSAELSLQGWACVFDFVELCDGDIAPMRDLDDPLNRGEDNLWFVVDAMDDVFIGHVGWVIGLSEEDCG